MRARAPKWEEARVLWASNIREAQELALLLCLCDGKVRERKRISDNLGCGAIKLHHLANTMDQPRKRLISFSSIKSYKITANGIAKARIFINRLKDIEDAQLKLRSGNRG